MKAIPFLILSAFFATAVNIPQKDNSVKGKVIGPDKNPLAGVNIIVKGSTIATLTDTNGYYELKPVKPNDSLIFSFIGYQTMVLTVKEADGKTITLDEEKIKLEEIVVTGYSITSEDGMEGRLSGVSVKKKPLSTKGSKSEYKSMELDYALEAETSDGVFFKPKGWAPSVAPGLLTAGEIHDFSKWKLWRDISENDLKNHKNEWEISPSNRYTLQVETENNRPVMDAMVYLIDKKKNILWKARTDNTGKAECWASLFDTTINNHQKYSLQVHYKGNVYEYNNANEFYNGINILKIPELCEIPKTVEVAFVVDATGSMGDEIDYLKAEMNDIMQKVKDSLTYAEVRLGCIFYRDHGDDYLVKSSDLTSDISNTIRFINANRANGGGDYPEAVEVALDSAINRLSWQNNAIARIIFLVLDAPPHKDKPIKNKIHELLKTASEKGIRVIPVACSGIDKSTEYLMRCMALATNGTYVFLTDHSGIGGHHIEPTTDKYEVEFLNGVLVRLICSYSYIQHCNSKPEITISDTLFVYNPEFLKSASDTTTVKDSVIIKNNDSIKNPVDIEPERLIRWKYYPNPTSGIVYVEIEGKINELFVSDLTGKIIQRHEIREQRYIELNLTNFPNGIYFIRYEYALDKWMSGKIILAH